MEIARTGQLLQGEHLQQFILQINNGYLDWEKVKDMNFKNSEFPNEVLWAQALAGRRQGFTRSITIGSENISWSVSNNLESVLRELDITLAGGAGIAAIITPKNEHRILINAMADETIASIQLSGVNITKKSGKELLLKKRPPQNVQEQMTVNYFKALQQIIHHPSESLSVEALLKLHETITRDTIGLKGVGKFRTNNKYDQSEINDKQYKGAEHKQLSALAEQLVEFFNNDKTPWFIHPLVKAQLIQYLVNFIRPFKDANGRLGRLLSIWYLLKQDYRYLKYMPVTSVVAKLKPQYMKAFSQVQQNNNDAGYFVNFQLQAMRMAMKSMQSALQKNNAEKNTNVFIKTDEYNERQAAALGWIKDDREKMITIREMRSAFGVSKETARTDLTALKEKGWLKFYHLNKKTYAFVKGDNFDELLSQLGK